jgi:hypothetical protein
MILTWVHEQLILSIKKYPSQDEGKQILPSRLGHENG